MTEAEYIAWLHRDGAMMGEIEITEDPAEAQTWNKVVEAGTLDLESAELSFFSVGAFFSGKVFALPAVAGPCRAILSLCCDEDGNTVAVGAVTLRFGSVPAVRHQEVPTEPPGFDVYDVDLGSAGTQAAIAASEALQEQVRKGSEKLAEADRYWDWIEVAGRRFLHIAPGRGCVQTVAYRGETADGSLAEYVLDFEGRVEQSREMAEWSAQSPEEMGAAIAQLYASKGVDLAKMAGMSEEEMEAEVMRTMGGQFEEMLQARTSRMAEVGMDIEKMQSMSEEERMAFLEEQFKKMSEGKGETTG